MKKLLFILLSFIVVSSCLDEFDDTCSLPVAGKWARVDANGFMTEFIEFRRGYYDTYETENKGYFHEGKVWAAGKSDFHNVTHDEYSIVNGVLHVGNTSRRVTFNEDILLLDNTKYYSLKNFTSDYYSTIKCNNPSDYTYPFDKPTVEWTYSVDKCPFGKKVSVSTEADWINAINVTDDVISFQLGDNVSGEVRTATVTLTYPTAKPVVISVKQACAEPKIILEETSLTSDYKGCDHSFSYSIMYPKAGLSVKTSCTADWITELVEKDGVVSFTVNENNSGAERTCNIVLTYGEVSESFNVVQTYSAPSLELYPEDIIVDYHEAKYCNFSGEIKNPRKDCQVEVSCSSNWITDINCKPGTETSFKVEFTVKENNDVETQRCAKIIVKYGDIEEYVDVTQTSDQPVITLTPSSVECGYVEGKYEFTYAIENPRETFAAEFQTDASWITEIVDNNGNVSFTVAENNSGSERIGDIVISYGHTTETFKVIQVYEAARIILSEKNITLDYHEVKYCYFSGDIVNPRKDCQVKATCNASWITDINCKQGSATSFKVEFTVKENNDIDDERYATIYVQYGDVQEHVNVTQTSDHPVINMTSVGDKYPYNEAIYAFSYSIENLRDSFVANITSSDEWITDITDNNGVVSFTLAENNDGHDRDGEITITYGSISKKFFVKQEYSETKIYLSPKEKYFNYAGGSSYASYCIVNPRKNAKINVSSNADWLKIAAHDTSMDGYIIFDVFEYTGEGEERSAQIQVSYAGVYESFSIHQTNEAPVINLAQGGDTFPYTETSYSISFTIDNPRENLAASAYSNYGWIKDITVIDGVLSFIVEENNDGHYRTGEVTVKYGNVTKNFIVQQEYLEPKIYLNANKKDFNYAGGSGNVTYHVVNPRQNQKVNVYCNADWVKIGSYNGSTDGNFLFDVLENSGEAEGRSTQIYVSYAGVTESITITQTNEAPVIEFDEEAMVCNYAKGSYSFKYTIENPREAFEVTLSTDSPWITGLTDDNGLVLYNVAENNSGDERVGKIKVTYGYVSAEYIVCQKCEKPNIKLYIDKTQFDYQSTSAIVYYEIDNPRTSLKVNAYSSASWLKITEISGTDEGKICIDIAENNDPEDSRYAHLTVTYGDVEANLSIVQTNEAPVINLAQGGDSFPYTETSYTVSFTIDNPREGLTATASTNDSWIKNVSVNNGYLSFYVTENNDGHDRDGQITLTYGNVTNTFIVQQKYEAAKLIVNANETNFNYTGGSSYIDYHIVNPRNAIKFNVYCSADWVKIGSYNGYETDGRLNFDVLEFSGTEAERSAQIVVTYQHPLYSYPDESQLFIITQTNEAPVINLAQGGDSFPYTETSYSVSYTIDNPREGLTATAYTSYNWIKNVTLKDGQLSFQVTENNDGHDRDGEITIAYGSVTKKFIVQQKYEAAKLIVNANETNFNYTGGSSYLDYHIVNPRNGVKFNVYCSADWVKFGYYHGYETDGRLNFDVLEFSGTEAERSAQIVVTYQHPLYLYPNESQSFTITQTNESPVINLAEGGKSFEYTESSYSVGITIDNPREGLTPTAYTSYNWIKNVTLKDGQLSFQVTENNDGHDRDGEITIAYGSVTKKFIVQQKYEASKLIVNANETNFNYTGGSSYLDYHIVNPRNGVKFNVYCSADWVKIGSYDGYVTDGRLNFDVLEFSGTEAERSAQIVVTYQHYSYDYPNESQSFTITQTNEAPVINLTEGGANFPYTETSYTVSFTIDNPREGLAATASTNDSWIKNVSVNNGYLSFYVTENNDGHDRTGEITIAYGNVTKKFIVQQKYLAPQLYIDADKTNFTYLGGSSYVDYHVVNPRKNRKLEVTCNAEWVKIGSYNGYSTTGKLTFQVLEFSGDGEERSAQISVSYDGVHDSFTITQTNASPVINLAEGGKSFEYTESSYSVGFTIDNPREGLTPTAYTSYNWIKNVTVNDGQLSFYVTENNDGNDRTGEITIAYGNVTKKFIVQQKYLAPQLYIDVDKTNFNYTGGSSYVDYHIVNPRNGVKFNVYCSADWVKIGSYDGYVTDGRLNFDVLEFSGTAPERSAQIVVTYQHHSYDYPNESQSFTITQTNEAPTITLSSTGVSLGYAATTYSVRCTIVNPREGITPTVYPDCSWIKNISVKDDTLVFTVTDNNDGGTRLGKITINYGSATATFIVQQTYVAPAVVLVKSNNSADRNGGTYNYTYIIKNPRNSISTQVKCNDDWVTFNSTEYKSGEDIVGTVTYNVAANTTSQSRSTYIYLIYGSTGAAFSLSQE